MLYIFQDKRKAPRSSRVSKTASDHISTLVVRGFDTYAHLSLGELDSDEAFEALGCLAETLSEVEKMLDSEKKAKK